MADVGVFCGAGSAIFWRELPVTLHIAVDDWQLPQYPVDQRELGERTYMAREAPPGMARILHRMPRTQALPLIPDASLDLVYLEKASRQDILGWLPKLTRHGAIAGHDYSARQSIGFGWDVCAAVHSVFLAPDEVFEDTSWLVWPYSVNGRCRAGKSTW
jgi:hypothetical protein